MNKTFVFIGAAVCGLFLTVDFASAQSTQFTYQGLLNDGANPANGIYDLQFAIYDSPNNGVLLAGPITHSATAVSNGLFTVTLDFGNAFPGADRFIEIGVRTNGSPPFIALAPRQKLTPAPYAITAGSVVSGGLASGTYSSAVTFSNSADNFNGTFAGNGAGVTNVNAATLAGLTGANFWNTTGNSGTSPGANFLGTADNQPLVFRANNLKVMQFAYASNALDGFSPNVIVGYNGNFVAAGIVGAVISGGGEEGASNAVTGDLGTIIGGEGNLAGRFAIAGGRFSQATGYASLAMGDGCTASGQYSIAFGSSTATNSYATAIGGSVANGFESTAMGGSFANGRYSTAMGGSTASGDYSFAAGGSGFANHNGTFVWADDSAFAAFQSSNSNQFLIRATGGVGIGLTNPAAPLHVAKGSAGNIIINPNSIAAFEKSANGYVSILAPLANETGILFGNDNNGADNGTDGGIIFNNFATARGLQFRTGTNTTRMVIQNSGNVGIGTTGPDALLTVNGAADKPGGGSWGTFSDARLKDIGAPFTNSLEALDHVQPVHYHYKTDNPLNLPAQPEYIGVVAQQVQRAVPESVERSQNGYLVVNNDPILWTVVNSVKELNRKLETENAELKRQHESLEKRIESLENLLNQKSN